MSKITIIETENINVESDYFLNDSRISLKAKGIMAMMLAYPCKDDFRISDFALFTKEGKNAVRTAMRELENIGYLARCQFRNELGQMLPVDYYIFENPFHIDELYTDEDEESYCKYDLDMKCPQEYCISIAEAIPTPKANESDPLSLLIEIIEEMLNEITNLIESRQNPI